MKTTDRLYSSAQLAFQTWCRTNRIRFPPRAMPAIADYLRSCAKERGASTVPVHLSAIASLYRERGLPLDTKATVIQAVVRRSRKRMRSASR